MAGSGEGAFLERMLSSLATPQELAKAAQPRMHPHNLRVLLQFSHNDLLLASMGITKDVCTHALLALNTKKYPAGATPMPAPNADSNTNK